MKTRFSRTIVIKRFDWERTFLTQVDLSLITRSMEVTLQRPNDNDKDWYNILLQAYGPTLADFIFEFCDSKFQSMTIKPYSITIKPLEPPSFDWTNATKCFQKMVDLFTAKLCDPPSKFVMVDHDKSAGHVQYHFRIPVVNAMTFFFDKADYQIEVEGLEKKVVNLLSKLFDIPGVEKVGLHASTISLNISKAFDAKTVMKKAQKVFNKIFGGHFAYQLLSEL